MSKQCLGFSVVGMVEGSAHIPQKALARPCPWTIQTGLKSLPIPAGIAFSDSWMLCLFGKRARRSVPHLIEDSSIHSVVLHFHLFVRCLVADGLRDSMRFGVGVIPQPKAACSGLSGLSTLASKQSFFLTRNPGLASAC